METFTIVIYCFLDDLLAKIDDKSLNKRRKLTNAQVITVVIVSAKYFYGNQAAACSYLQDHQGFTIPNKSNPHGRPRSTECFII